MNLIAALWAYRGFIVSSVQREFQSRYRNSLLGAAWTVIQPLALILVYTLIFSGLMRARLPGDPGPYAYGIYLCAGMLAWNYFAEVVVRCQNVFLDNANVIKKLSFPRLCLPVIVVAGATLNFAMVFGLFVVFLVASGNFPGWVFFAIVPVLLVQVAFSVGLGVALGVLHVFFRDVGQALGVLLQFWFWLTPIVYTVDVLPAAVSQWMAFNPMASLVAAYQDVLLHGRMPAWHSLVGPTVLALALCAVALALFRRHAGDMVDEL